MNGIFIFFGGIIVLLTIISGFSLESQYTQTKIEIMKHEGGVNS